MLLVVNVAAELADLGRESSQHAAVIPELHTNGQAVANVGSFAQGLSPGILFVGDPLSSSYCP